MRRLLLILSLLAAFVSSAQTHYNGNITVGAKAGVDMSRVFFSPTVYQGFKPGFTAGLTFRYIEENHFGIIAELDFLQKGWKEDFGDAPYKYSRTLNYLQIPILAHIYFGGRHRFFINAGPEIGFFLGESTSSNFDVAQMSTLFGFPNTNRMNVQMTLDATNKVDFGISAGFGCEFGITHGSSVNLEARFYYGLGNMFPSERQDPFSASNAMALSATVGYMFRLK